MTEQPSLKISKTLFNDAYLPFMNSTARIELFFGGGGSGKSFFLAQRDVIDVLTKSYCNKLTMRKTAASNHDSTFADYNDIIYKWKLDKYFKINSSKGDERITCARTKNEILFGGCKDKKELEKVKGIRAMSGPISHIRMEEATEFERRDFIQLNNVRLRGETPTPKNAINKTFKRMTLSMNPISSSHWIKKDLIDSHVDNSIYLEHNQSTKHIHEITSNDKRKRLVVLKTTHLDNKFYGEEERSELLKLKDTDKYYYDVYVLGNWGILGNTVFSNYVIEDFDEDENTLENVFNGVDFGTVHASTFMRGGFKNDEIYVFDELYGKGWTNSDFIAEINKKFGYESHGWPITCDSAEEDRRIEMEREGFQNIQPAKKGPGSLKYGIEYLMSKKIHIHKTKCPNLARELPMFKRREDKDGNVIDAFVELNDDTIAGLRYGTEYIWSNLGDTIHFSGIGIGDIFGNGNVLDIPFEDRF